jgi:predicted phosphodiesterase
MKHSIPKSYYKSNARDVKLSRGKTIAVFSDIHAPYHDVDALVEAVTAAKKSNPDVVILLGDIMDFHRISRYPNDAGTLSFADEITVGVELLKYMRHSFPNAEFYYIEGNHEVRLAHYIQRNAAELQGLSSLDLSFLLQLDELEIPFIQMGFIHCGDMTFLHGHELPGIGGVNPSRKLFTKMKKSAMCGHLHRPESFFTRDGAGKLLQCHIVGHLGDPHPRYWMRNEWQHGYAIVDVSKGGVVRVDNVIL